VLDEICKKEHKFYTIIYRNGFKQMISKLPYLFGSFLAIIIIFIYMFSFSLFIHEVDVSYSSNLSYDMTKVEKVLSDNGIKSGMARSSVDIQKIQNLLMINVDDISACTAKCVGGKLTICVFPAQKKQEVSSENIVSKYDAVVTKIETFAGEKSVQVGDVVKKGDLLILNKNGAQGIVEGKVYFVSTIIYNENQQKLVKTGNCFVSRNFKIFNKFEIKSNNFCTFSTFVTEKCSFYLYNNYFLPIICDETIYYETRLENEIVPFEKVEKNITMQAYDDALKKVPEKDKISNVSYSIVKDGAYTRVDCYIEAEMSLI
jgi:similar to stage IV sporulation protein